MEKFVDWIKACDDHFIGDGADIEEIKETEDRLNLEFSVEYKDYLKKYGVASADGHEFTGIVNSPRLNVVDVTMKTKKDHDVAAELYVVELLQIDGIIIWQNKTGEVFMMSNNGELSKIGDNLMEYLKA